ncbi:hypothetical protein HDC92_004960 [Pedobacter sp. AK017]|uniref:hypothetical protein n=1 Tax=Pedobacter sp. AK017 TaxID=2723073 RepID=UPI001617BCA2|nr:hypothetical protein [Pedobacter sp. AK017]MBB5441253.1 hypothetical protein [Pedobacter sp. AK017]
MNKLFITLFFSVVCIFCSVSLGYTQSSPKFDRIFPHANGPLNPFEVEVLPAGSPLVQESLADPDPDAGRCVYKNRLYIHSKKRSKNLHRYEMGEYTIIDVYLNGMGTYLYSFCLPKYKRFKVRSFKITDDQLIALQGNYQVTYNILKFSF